LRLRSFRLSAIDKIYSERFGDRECLSKLTAGLACFELDQETLSNVGNHRQGALREAQLAAPSSD
jgi:hypothetical protein